MNKKTKLIIADLRQTIRYGLVCFKHKSSYPLDCFEANFADSDETFCKNCAFKMKLYVLIDKLGVTGA
jgi:hypothetical protein